MAVLEITLTNQHGSFRQSTVLDGVQYILAFHWNGTDDRWFMDIMDASANAIITGIPLVLNWPLTYKFVGRVSKVPPGQFFVLNETSINGIPTRNNLGQNVKLIYVEASGV